MLYDGSFSYQISLCDLGFASLFQNQIGLSERIKPCFRCRAKGDCRHGFASFDAEHEQINKHKKTGESKSKNKKGYNYDFSCCRKPDLKLLHKMPPET